MSYIYDNVCYYCLFYCFIGIRRPARDVRGCVLEVIGTENPGKLPTVVKKKFNLF